MTNDVEARIDLQGSGAREPLLKYSLQEMRRGLKTSLSYYRAIYEHPRTPRLSKVLLWVAIAYLASPIDIIPDFVPILGQLDDMVIVPLLLFLALRMIPGEVAAECSSANSGCLPMRPL